MRKPEIAASSTIHCRSPNAPFICSAPAPEAQATKVATIKPPRGIPWMREGPVASQLDNSPASSIAAEWTSLQDHLLRLGS